MTKLSSEKGIVKLPSGLMYKVITKSKDTVSPKVTDLVKVHYEGRLIDGTVFDSSYSRGTPAAFVLKEVVKAWQIALPLMHKGDVWEIYVPAELGYGDQEAGQIPANSVLIFKIQLIDVLAS